MNKKTTTNTLLGQRTKYAPRNKLLDNTLNVLWLGQSNATKMFTGFSGAGNTAFTDALSSYYSTINSINGGSASVAIHKDSDNGGGYYWDLAGNAPGTKLTDALTAIDNAGISRKAIDIVVIVQGERDGNTINAGTITATQAKDALFAYISYLRTQLDNPFFLVTPLGADRTSANFNGWGAMRRAQWELWNSYPSYIIENAGFWDQTYDDNVNLTQIGYENFGHRTARRILATMGKISAAGTLGPRITNATFSVSADRIYVNIAHDAGTDFTLTERRGNSTSTNAGAYISIPTSVARNSATQFQINNGANLLTGDVIKFSFPWGTLQGHTPANCLIDNATNPMPLRPSFDITVIETP